MQNLELVKIVEENKLDKTQGQIILDNFTGFFKEASEWEAKAKQILITDISQKDEMAKARQARLALKNIRTIAEKARVKLKEKSRREGLAIDGIANVLKALIIPIEEHLDKQEKFAENLEKERLEKIYAQREMELRKYTEDVSLYNFKEMNNEVFTKLLSTLKMAWDAEQEATKKVEQERIEKEKLEAEAREKQRLENIKLKKEAEAREKELVKERAEQEKKLEAERMKAKKEAEAREKIEAELKAKKVEEERVKKEEIAKLQADKIAKLEADKQEKLKPEKEKLFAFAEQIKTLETPTELSMAGRAIVEEAEKGLLAIAQKIKLNIKNL